MLDSFPGTRKYQVNQTNCTLNTYIHHLSRPISKIRGTSRDKQVRWRVSDREEKWSEEGGRWYHGEQGGEILPEGDFWANLEETRKQALQTPGDNIPRRQHPVGRLWGTPRWQGWGEVGSIQEASSGRAGQGSLSRALQVLWEPCLFILRAMRSH